MNNTGRGRPTFKVNKPYVSPMSQNTDLTGRGRRSTPGQDKTLRVAVIVAVTWLVFVFGVALGRS